MNVVVTGATGFVGARVLEALLAAPDVDQVVALTRRALARAHDKLHVVVLADFLEYAAAHDALATSDACIWTLGGKASDTPSLADYARVTHDFPLAFAKDRAAAARPFRFCYLSGMGADPTESARLPWERDTRHLKGRTERDLEALATTTPGFTVHAFRPAGIVADAPWTTRLLAPIAVDVDRLAAALVDVAVHGSASHLVLHRQLRGLAARRHSRSL